MPTTHQHMLQSAGRLLLLSVLLFLLFQLLLNS
jgi:hypothetical protein